jgi:hypothetical protein
MTDADGAADFGRIDADGTVYVRTSAGERVVGQWAGGDPAAGLAFYRRRFEGLEVEVDLLERRIEAGALSPEDASAAARKIRRSIDEAQAVGDLDALVLRIDALGPVIEARKAARKAERAVKGAEAKQAKQRLVEEAERLASGTDWRQGAQRLREMLSTWKTLPRIDKETNDALWHRFSSARTTYTRRSKQHFADLNERREAASTTKEKLVAEAEALSASTEWAATARAYRELMARWKAAGGAHKAVDDALWARFRAAQDTFFKARDAVNAREDAEYAANAEVKRQLLAEAETLLPVRDHKKAREAFRDVAQRWDSAGKVPRGEMKDLEARFTSVEQEIRGAEDERWRRRNPAAAARAAATVGQLEASIAAATTRLEQARSRGDEQAATQAQADVDARESWLEEARKAFDEFSG